MGSDARYAEEKPQHRLQVNGFWMDETAVTHAAFAAFVTLNLWQGAFPWRNLVSDGFTGTCPVHSFPPNGHGLFEVCGNVREWTNDWWGAQHGADPTKPCCTPLNPRGSAMEASFRGAQPGIRMPRRVVKGRSLLCAPSYRRRYRPAARHAQMVDTGMSHIGFRCIRRDRSEPQGKPVE